MSHREVMQQALEAIRIFREWEMGQDYESCRATVLARALAAEESLGAALAEPQEPSDMVLVPRLLLERASESLGAFISDHGWAQADMDVMDDIDGTLAASCAPQRQPLTDEEVDYIWESEKAFPDIYAIVRAIERAHGIGGQDEQG